ncbi:hypothetical protein KIN20_022145 [Parelaphostrongylus tenuis]|uniref:Uncharacterized protein n=1 Tax=Parelaphostrongylus tenuis TaxID=148309 RepID=A0AAD5N7Q9_PARTN|nr:hypothetical protein KIN20_022145 [Parelaphostrongylus tenuis]
MGPQLSTTIQVLWCFGLLLLLLADRCPSVQWTFVDVRRRLSNTWQSRQLSHFGGQTGMKAKGGEAEKLIRSVTKAISHQSKLEWQR